MNKGRPLQVKPPIAVVYRKRKKGKAYLSVFEDIDVDAIINGRRHNPLIPDNYIIEEIGLGSFLIEEYKRIYKIKNIREI